MDNDAQLSEMFGKNIQLFQKNKADIAFDRIDYEFVKLHETTESSELGEQILITINNPYELKIRLEKQIAIVLDMSRSQVKNLLEKEEIEVKTILPKLISISVLSAAI